MSYPRVRIRPQAFVVFLVSSLLAEPAAPAPTPVECPAPVLVRDPIGALLPEAEILVEPAGRVLVTNQEGMACLGGLPAGTYRITARKAHFQEVSRDVTLPPSTDAPLELSLRLSWQEQVIVTGTRAEGRLRAVPYSVSVIDRRELASATADSAGEILRDVPGVQLTDTSLAGNKRPRIRGEVGSNVLILVDGREISEQRSFHGGAPLLLDLADVDRVEVVRGPSGVVYGSKAIGGTINFITDPPANKRLAGRASLAVSSGTAGYDGSVRVSGTLGAFDYRASAARADHGDRRVPDRVRDNAAYAGAIGRLENSGFDSTSLTAELGRCLGRSRLFFRLEDFVSAVESHTSDDVLEGGLDRFQLDLPRQDRRTFTAAFRGHGLAARIPSLSLTAYRQKRMRDFDQTLGLSQADFAGPGSRLDIDLGIDTSYTQTTTGLLSSVEWVPAAGHRIVAGVDLVRDDMDAAIADQTTTTIRMPRRPDPTVDVSTEAFVTRSRQGAAGAFLQEDWTVHRRLRMVLGGRYNVFDSSLRSTTNPHLTTGSSRDAELSTSASLLFEPSPHGVLRASYSQGYRHPSLLELYEGTAHGGGGLLYPNPDLRPETSDNLEIGARLEVGPLSLDAAAFYTRARDYVTTRSCGVSTACPAEASPGTDRVYDNVNGARTRGVEASLTYGPGGVPVEVFAEATYLHRRFEQGEQSTDRTGLPALYGHGGIRIGRSSARPGRVFAELWVRAAAATEEEVAPAEIERYPGWAIVSARAGLELGTRTPTTLILEAGNLFDRAYRPAQESLYQPGRHIVAKLVTRF